MRADEDMFKHADAGFIGAAPSCHGHLTDGLDMEVLQDVFVFFGHNEFVVVEDVVAAIHTVVALFIEVSDSRHEGLLHGLVVKEDIVAVALKEQLGVRDVSSVGFKVEVIFNELQRDLAFGFEIESHSGVGDGEAVLVFGACESYGHIAEIDGRPDPEILRRAQRRDRLAVGVSDGPDAPRSVARAKESVIVLSGGFDVDGFAVEFELPFVGSVLDEASEVDEDARPDALGGSFFEESGVESGKDDLATEGMLVIFDGEAEFLERLDDFERHGSDVQVHALAVEEAGSVDVVLLAVDGEREGRVDDVEVGVESERPHEVDFAIAAVSVEEVTVVEVAVGAGKGERLGRLMNGEVVPFGEHDGVPPDVF